MKTIKLFFVALLCCLSSGAYAVNTKKAGKKTDACCAEKTEETKESETKAAVAVEVAATEKEPTVKVCQAEKIVEPVVADEKKEGDEPFDFEKFAEFARKLKNGEFDKKTT